ncbi:MAG: flagellar M-ring protein FliF C-terminal domain-containing protein [Planctomycetota bacterium]
MDTIRQQLERIQGQLSGLSASQKMLTGALVAIMVITIMWWSSYAATGEFQPVLDGAMTPQEMADARTALTGAGIDMKLDGSRIMVPADQLEAAVSALGFANAMPGNSADSFDKMVEKMSAWDPAFKTKEFFAEAKRRKLESIILVDRNITHADVVFDLNRSTRIGQRSRNSATVSVWTRDGNVKADRGLVEGLANIVAGAVNELATGDVKVNVNGRLQRVAQSNGPIDPDQLFERRAMVEADYADKIYDTFADIPNILVSVTAEVNPTKRSKQAVTYDQDGTVVVPTSESTTTTTSSDGAGAGEPGAVPNIGLELAGGGGVNSSDSETADTKNEVKVGEQRVVEETAAGEAKVVRAVVRVPLSHIKRDFMARNPDIETPDGEMLATHEENEVARIRSILMNVVALDTADDISVETYADQLPPSLDDASLNAGMTLPGGMSVGTMMTSYGREAVIGLLAVVSLFMVSMMVRKASPTITTEVPDLESALAQLRGESVVGEVGESDNLMDAQEIDPEMMQTKQMVEQVQSLVGENPEAAAALIRRWVQD